MRTIIALATIASLAAAPAAASTTTLTQEQAVSLTGTSVYGEGGSARESFDIPLFDPSLGTLTRVRFRLALDHAATLSSANIGDWDETIASWAPGQVTFCPDFTDCASNEDRIGLALDLAPGESGSASGHATNLIAFSLDADDLGFADAIGPGGAAATIETVDANWWDLQGSSLNGYRYDWSFSGTLSVIYTYVAAAVARPPSVPEPAAFAILGAGLVGLTLLRRRA